eukprot:9770688-Lingulodinium_polyedra.AAC.1
MSIFECPRARFSVTPSLCDRPYRGVPTEVYVAFCVENCVNTSLCSQDVSANVSFASVPCDCGCIRNFDHGRLCRQYFVSAHGHGRKQCLLQGIQSCV